MDKIIKRFMAKCHENKRKRFDLDDLEKYVIKACEGQNEYLNVGGYSRLHKEIILMKKDNEIREIETSSYNGLNPTLKTRWQIILKEGNFGWEKSKILQLSDSLEFSYYIKYPIYQTDTEWEYIKNIHAFLKIRESREWASLEERSLELFYDEKFLRSRKETVKGKYGILNRLRLSYEDLKIKKYGEMFIYWNRGTQNIKNIIILENHSTFFSYKRAAEKKGDLFGFVPDALIYGEGKKIENSLSFLEEITDITKVRILYFGDIDSEGFGIYYRLKERYSGINIKLQYEAYNHLIKLCSRDYPLGEQKKKVLYLTYFIDEIKCYMDNESIEKLDNIWNEDCRIPQELITYEYLIRVEK